jgi:hypothetical protein
MSFATESEVRAEARVERYHVEQAGARATQAVLAQGAALARMVDTRAAHARALREYEAATREAMAAAAALTAMVDAQALALALAKDLGALAEGA